MRVDSLREMAVGVSGVCIWLVQEVSDACA